MTETRELPRLVRLGLLTVLTGLSGYLFYVLIEAPRELPVGILLAWIGFGVPLGYYQVTESLVKHADLAPVIDRSLPKNTFAISYTLLVTALPAYCLFQPAVPDNALLPGILLIIVLAATRVINHRYPAPGSDRWMALREQVERDEVAK